MYQYDDPTCVAVMPVAGPLGTGGFFTDANPGGGIAATRLRADFMNHVMMELLNVVTGVGLTPSKTTYNQLFSAIKTIVQQETGNYGADTGTANTYNVAYNPVIAALTDGLVLRFKALNANSGASTFQVNAISPKNIVRDDGAGSALLAGDIPANAIIEVVYDLANTRFVLTSVNQNISTLQIQQQTSNYAAGGGTANAHTATYTPAVSSHITGMPLRFKAANSNSGATTFNPGAGVKNLIGRDGGALVGGEILAGAIYEVQYDGTAYQLMGEVVASTTRSGRSRFSTSAEAIAGSLTTVGVTPAGLAAVLQQGPSNWEASNLIIRNNAGTPNTQIDYSMDRVTLLNANGLPLTLANLSGTINAALTGAINRLTAGALANNTAYDVWAICKPDGSGGGCVLDLASNSSTNYPGATTVTNINAISGYTGFFAMRLGTVLTGGAATFRGTLQVGREVFYQILGATTGLPVIISGASGSVSVPTWTATQVRVNSGAQLFVPLKARRVKVVFNFTNISSNTQAMAAPNSTYGAIGGITNPAPLCFTTNNTAQSNVTMADDWALENDNVYYAATAGAAGNVSLHCKGWTEPVNAS